MGSPSQELEPWHIPKVVRLAGDARCAMPEGLRGDHPVQNLAPGMADDLQDLPIGVRRLVSPARAALAFAQRACYM
jgi:hypothetical protein